MFKRKISRDEVLSAIDYLIDDYCLEREQPKAETDDKKYYEYSGAIKALEKLKHKLGMREMLSSYRQKQRGHKMNLEEIISIFNEAVPYRTPAKYGQVDNKWYIYSENKADNGKHLTTLIENGWFYIENGKCYPTTPIDIPRDITLSIVPFELR